MKHKVGNLQYSVTLHQGKPQVTIFKGTGSRVITQFIIRFNLEDDEVIMKDDAEDEEEISELIEAGVLMRTDKQLTFGDILKPVYKVIKTEAAESIEHEN